MTRPRGPTRAWWTPRVGEREVLLSLAATPGPLPAAVATRLAEGRDPSRLLRAHSPEPAAVAARLDALGSAAPGPGRRRLAAGGHAARPTLSLAVRLRAGPAGGGGVGRGGWRTPRLAAAPRRRPLHRGRAGQRRLVRGQRRRRRRRRGRPRRGPGRRWSHRCRPGLRPRRSLSPGQHRPVRQGPGLRRDPGQRAPARSQPRAANFLPRNRLIAALSTAVVVVEAAEDSGSLSTARAAGSRGVGHVLVLPGAPWDPGAAGCNQLIRDGATLVRSLTDILEELGATVPAPPAAGPRPGPVWILPPERS